VVTIIAGLPGGYRYNDGTFYNIGYLGYWWSSSEANTNYLAWSRTLNASSIDLGRVNSNQRHGFSVRCLRD